ncbi:hypothetical protein [Nannocystis sp.]|uniref:hypothetical protein n=1 Tax=Nannocystis sp. TaxID=1962667 RepID=UPI0025F2D2E5|nr:hypothetical protein [Nannocystis sp.]MBK7830003.1 hypothetical protein [Nannocystis sp.]
MDARGRPDELMGGAAMGEAVQVGDALVDQAGATEPRARGYAARSAPRQMEHDLRDRSSGALKRHAARGASRLGRRDETGCLALSIALRGPA